MLNSLPPQLLKMEQRKINMIKIETQKDTRNR